MLGGAAPSKCSAEGTAPTGTPSDLVRTAACGPPACASDRKRASPDGLMTDTLARGRMPGAQIAGTDHPISCRADSSLMAPVPRMLNGYVALRRRREASSVDILVTHRQLPLPNDHRIRSYQAIAPRRRGRVPADGQPGPTTSHTSNASASRSPSRPPPGKRGTAQFQGCLAGGKSGGKRGARTRCQARSQPLPIALLPAQMGMNVAHVT